MSLIYNATFDSQTRILSLMDKAGNVISSCEVPSKELVDDPNKPLMLRAIEDNSSVTLAKRGKLSNTYQTSTDGTSWTYYTLGTEISLNKGESVYFRCSVHPTTQSYSDYVYFYMNGKVEAWHNAYSMISSDFSSAEGSVGDWGMTRLFSGCASLTKAPLLLNALSQRCYDSMFSGCTSLTQAPSLPATTLAEYCYSEMFRGCTSLTQAQSLPATTLAFCCYDSMFSGCTSLTQAPLLPAKRLAQHCYELMFSGCTSLTQAPSLPATYLLHYCYNSMFSGCTSLTQAPSLPETYLSPYCYDSMFRGCTSLTQAPLLPATTLADNCYESMFRGCSKLKEVRIAATSKALVSLNQWLSGVSATGDFYCDPNATIFPTDSDSGIPSGWSRFVLGAEDTGNTTAMYHNGATETVMIGTSDYGVCYALQGWAGFKTLSEIHALGYTFGAQTPLTMYHGSDPVSAYSCDANIDDGFTETMYDVGDGNGYLDIATQNANGYTLTAPNP